MRKREADKVSEVNIICVGCPLGCAATLTIGEDGKLAALTGCKCKAGQKYVVNEYKKPVRVLTGTILTQDSAQPLLPVRTATPILKEKLLAGMKVLAETRVRPPVRIGDVIISNLLGTRVSVVATSDLPI